MLMACTISVSARVPEIAEKESAIYTMNYFAENPAPGSVYGEYQPTATLHTIYFDHNVYENGLKGMNIHLDLHINNAQGRKCRVNFFFYYKNGDKLMDNNGKYRTTDGQCVVNKVVVPGYDNTHYSDLVVFMPNREFEFDGTRAELKCVVRVYDIDWGRFIEKERISRSFNMTR